MVIPSGNQRRDRTPLAWLREWPEAPGQKNLAGVIERLQGIRKLGVCPDREQLTDAALVMFDKMLGSVFRRADQAHKEHVADRAKTLDASTRALIGMAKAMLAAKACGEDQIAAVERVLGWERLNTLVAETDKVVTATRKDNLSEIVCDAGRGSGPGHPKVPLVRSPRPSLKLSRMTSSKRPAIGRSTTPMVAGSLSQLANVLTTRRVTKLEAPHEN